MIQLTFQQQVKNKNRFSVFWGEEYLFSLSRYTYQKLGQPTTLTVESVDAFRMECMFPEQYNYCLGLLSRRGYSRKELHDKLAERKVPEEIIGELLARLTREKLICDEAFQESFVRSRQTYQKQGFYKIRQELARRGIELSREDYDITTELANIAALVAKLLAQKVEHRKIIQRLMARGFSYGDIVSCLKASGEAADYEEYTDNEC